MIKNGNGGAATIGGVRVLVVDDMAIFREPIAACLRQAGFAAEYRQVLEAQDRTGMRRDAVERLMLGVTHKELVGLILVKLGLPDSIRKPIEAMSSAPAQRSPDPAARILVMANAYANGLTLCESAVDDQASFRAVVALRLKGAGHEVTEVADGADALRLVRSVVPDLILLDLSMPTVDGFAVLRELHRNPDMAAATRVFVVTATSDEATREWVMAEGACDCLLKTRFSLAELVDRVEGHLRRPVGFAGDHPGLTPEA
jgi:CheY-like chemotaxis protein